MRHRIKELQNKPNGMAYLCLLAVCFFWGTTWVASSYSVRQGLPAFQVVALRQLIAGLILFIGIIIFNKKEQLVWPTFKDTLFLAILNFVFSNGVSTWGVQYIPAGAGSIVGATYPLWLVLIYFLFFNREIKPLVWIGMIVSFIGLLIIFLPKLLDVSVDKLYLFGLGISIFSSITWALGNIYIKNQNEKNVNPYLSLSLQMLLSGSFIYIALYQNLNFSPIREIPVNVWYGIIYLVIAGSLIAYVCFLYALKHLPAEQVSLYAYINPIVALFISSLLMQEEITFYIIIGTIIALFGLYLVNRTFMQ